jgi:hypothetical protein
MSIFPLFVFPGGLTLGSAGLKKGKEAPGERLPALTRFQTASSLEKISPTCQDNSAKARMPASSSTNAVSFSSACTTRRFPSSRCASAIQNVRPLESIAETQPQLQSSDAQRALIIYAFLKIDRRCRSQEQFNETRLVSITHRGFAIWLDPFGMLDPQVVVNLLLEFGVRVDLMRHGNWPR